MPSSGAPSSAGQLAGYLATLSTFDDEPGALRGALALAAEAFGAAGGALVAGTQVLTAVGLPADASLAAALLEAAATGGSVEVPGAGPCAAVAVPVVLGEMEARLALARAPGPFSVAEADLLRLMATVLAVTVENLRKMASLHAEVGDAMHRSLHDPLTGLANRTRLLDRLEHSLAQRRLPGVTVGVVYVDVDEFKSVNDRLGHAAGDLLLVEAARRLRNAVRMGDTVARIGGDEFAVLIENAAGASEASAAAGRILEAFRQPFVLGGAEASVSASVGVAVLESDPCAADDLLRNADVAMYRAKNSGKDRAVLFEAAMYEAILDRLQLETDLRRVVGAGEIEVFFQPVVCLSDERVLGVEALARWAHPERGYVAPDTFIPLAEHAGLILALGHQVLVDACRWAGEWHRDHPGAELFLSVNLSAQQLQDPSLPEAVAGALAASGLNPGDLVLEVTEGVLLHDSDEALSHVRALKALGVRLALDDFGTGYSSLSFLRRFPIDVLKIDKSLVHALRRGEDPGRLVEAVIALGGALRLDCLAEGVERVDEVRALKALGCDMAQGRFFAGAMPGVVLERFLAGRAAGSTVRVRA